MGRRFESYPFHWLVAQWLEQVAHDPIDSGSIPDQPPYNRINSTRQENQVPIIILEGIDGSGKSTLATHLKELSPWPATIIHRGPIQTSVFEEYVAPLFEVDTEELLIADRWHLSELIYGPIYRGESLVDEEFLDQIETVLSSLGAARFIVSPPFTEVGKRLKARGEDFLQPGHQMLVHTAYHGLACQLGYTQVPTSDRMTAMAILGAMAAQRVES